MSTAQRFYFTYRMYVKSYTTLYRPNRTEEYEKRIWKIVLGKEPTKKIVTNVSN